MTTGKIWVQRFEDKYLVTATLPGQTPCRQWCDTKAEAVATYDEIVAEFNEDDVNFESFIQV